MPGYSKIAWTDATWNPVVGCTHVSAGCDHCYAKTLHDQRHKAVLAGAGLPPQYKEPFEVVQCLPERLDIPLRWTKPRMIFVNSVSDLFHADVPTNFIDAVFGVMAGAKQHVFQVLTKRPQRMMKYLNDPDTKYRIWHAGRGVAAGSIAGVRIKDWYDQVPIAKGDVQDHPLVCSPAEWPLPNVWLGTSVENQEAAYRIDALVKTPAAVRFISAEPLLGPIDLTRWLYRRDGYDGDVDIDWRLDDLHWVIAGGESGSGHREADVDWFDGLHMQCENAGVAFFMKQDSGAKSGLQGRIPDDLWSVKQFPDGREKEAGEANR